MAPMRQVWLRLRRMVVSEDFISDGAQIEDRIGRVIWRKNPDIIVLLQPTSPVRTGHHIDEAISLLIDSGADSLVSVVPSHVFLWSDHPIQGVKGSYDPEHRSNRQDFQSYEENGSIYVFTRQHWEKTHCRLGGKIVMYEMPEYCRVQVDTYYDLWLAEQTLIHYKDELWPPSPSLEEKSAQTTPHTS